MTELELVADALIAGAAAGITGATSSAIQDTYNGFRESVRRHLVARGSRHAEALDTAPPNPEAWRQQLLTALAASDVARDRQVIETARLLLAEFGSKVAFDNRGAQGIVIGNNNTQNNTFSS
jgi:hypothetical protein